MIKPNHLSTSTGTWTTKKEDLLQMTVKKQIKQLTELGLYKLDKTEQATYIKDRIGKVDGGGSRRGILIQPMIDFDAAEGNLVYIGEIRLSLVFGSVEVIQYGRSEKECGIMDEDYRVTAQSYRKEDNSFAPIVAEPETHGRMFADKFNSMQEDCWKKFEKGVNWKLMIKKIDCMGKKLHMDYIRIDVFPRTYEKFYINEIEVNNGLQIINYKNHIIKKLEDGWDNVNKMSKETPNQPFISVEEAKKDFNDHCFEDN